MDQYGTIQPQEQQVYLVGNGKILIRRQFGGEKTVAELIASEISHGVLQSGVLNLPAEHDIMCP